LPFLIKDPRYGAKDKNGNPILPPPALTKDPTPYATVKEWISNDFDYYDQFPDEEQRFRRFINFVGDVVGSKSLFEDTYPISIDRRWFRPGVIAALPRAPLPTNAGPDGEAETAGHSQMVTSIDKRGVINYLKSTTPAKIQVLQPTTLNTFVPSPSGGSFRYWKQPKHYRMKESDIPGYGTEQFDIKNEGVFEDAMQARLAMETETKQQKLARLAGEVCKQIEQRVPMVDEGWAVKEKMGERCMDYSEFDAYSTPSRDGKIKKALNYLLLTATGDENGDVAEVAAVLDKACGAIEYLPGKKITAAKFSARLMAGKVSSDPNQPKTVRWGDEEAKSLGCKQYY
jgi:hypothetical protein